MRYLPTVVMTLCLAPHAVWADSGFAGYYAGILAGSNESSKSSSAGTIERRTGFPSLVAGYAADYKGWVIGGEAFADLHQNSVTYRDGGVGIRIGRPVSSTLFYGRLATTGTWPSWRPQYGFGIQSKLDHQWSLNTLYTWDKTNESGFTWKNNSLMVGFNYQFR